MNLKSTVFGTVATAAVLAVSAVMAAPAEAFSVAFGSQINLTGQQLNRSANRLNFVGPFSSRQSIEVRSTTGSFVDPTPVNPFDNTVPQVNIIASNLASTAITDLDITASGYTGPVVSNFIRRLRVDQNLVSVFPPRITNTDMSFDLIGLTIQTNTNLDFLARLRGQFRVGNTIISDGIGTLTSQANGSTYSLTLTAVPTPALLPAAVGFGAAMLRKRKGEAAEAEQETAEVKA